MLPSYTPQDTEGTLSRANTLPEELNTLHQQASPTKTDTSNTTPPVIHNWTANSVQSNNAFLRQAYQHLVKESKLLPDESRLVMYEACDDHEIVSYLGSFRRRIDARRNTKPKKPDSQNIVCTPFDPSTFNFTKIKNPAECIAKLMLIGGPYSILSNKFPLFPGHMLLVSDRLVPQQMTANHLASLAEFVSATSFCAYFNSWCASASVNHFHVHLIDEFPPVTSLPLEAGPLVGGKQSLRPVGFTGFCYVFPRSDIATVADAVDAMKADNQPHNLLLTPSLVYLFPKPHSRPTRSFDLYPETVGGPELIGSFTVYNDQDYHALSSASMDELVKMNTAPFPTRLLIGTSEAASGKARDDLELRGTNLPNGKPLPLIRSSRSMGGIKGARMLVSHNMVPTFC